MPKPSSKSSAPPRLETRASDFALDCRTFVRKMSGKALSADAQELLLCSGALGASSIAASEAPSKRAFLFFVRTALKRAKEARYWLTLLNAGEKSFLAKERERLVSEADQLLKICGAIVRNVRAKAA